MTHPRAILKAIPAALIMCACSIATAADTQNLIVTGTVQAVCKFASVPALNFNIDPSAATSQSGTASITYNCTKSQAPTIGVSSGSLTGRTLTGPASATMAYDLTVGTLSASTGFSAVNSVDITATVLQADYQDKAAGTYTETVGLTISP